MIDAKPKALQLVEESENDDWIVGTGQWREEAAAELRRLHEENTTLRQAIEQAEKQEPVAWLVRDYVDGFRYVSSTENPSGTIAKLSEPLYTAPPRKEWVGLTDEERNLVLDKNTWASGYASWKQFAIDIEAKLKEKNGV
jgi:hypothetical protein